MKSHYLIGAAALCQIGLTQQSLAGNEDIPKRQTTRQPNILVILTDQFAANMLSCEGNRGIQTPALDQLSREGMCFDRAYSANPVSIPSRFSLMTGTFPSVIGMETNNEIKHHVPDTIRLNSIGFLMQKAGYQTVYLGKKHLTGSDSEHGYENPYAYGFEEFLTPKDYEGREPSVQECIKFLNREHDKPFFIYLSLINPHDICYKPLNEELIAHGKNPLPKNHKAMQVIERVMPSPETFTEKFIQESTPSLPFNYDRPIGHHTSFYNNAGYIKWASDYYTDNDWRIYRYLYNRLIEDVDNQIGRVLSALKESGYDQNTLVIFTSDHGEMNGAHHMTTKGVLYEESVRIPLIVRWPGVIEAGVRNDKHLISNGLDLLPTLCDFAGISPEGKPGKSLKPILLGEKTSWRKSLVVESDQSRLVLFDDHWKYMVSSPRKTNAQYEVLIDLKKDHGEMENHAKQNPEQVTKGRKLLKEWYQKHNLQLDPKYIVK